MQKQFTQMIEKARLEAERSKTAALNSDLQLASRIQNVLMPQGLIDCGDNWECAFFSEAAQGITGEFLDIVKSKDSLRFYLVDLYDSGIKASVMSMIYKSFLDFMMADKECPEQVLESLQKFLIDKSYDDALANIFIGFIDVSSGKLDYVCAGVGMGFHISDDKYERLIQIPTSRLWLRKKRKFRFYISRKKSDLVCSISRSGNSNCSQTKLYSLFRDYGHYPDE